MKNKILITVLSIFLILVLAGCSIIPLPDTDKTKIKSIINEYFWAINDQDWDEAKNCCVYWTDRYDATCDLEECITDLWEQYGEVKIFCFVTIDNVFIEDKYADADIYLYVEVTIGIDDIPYYDDSDYYHYYLKEVEESTWKIYGPEIGEFI